MWRRDHGRNVLGFGAFRLSFKKVITYASMDHTFVVFLHEYVPFYSITKQNRKQETNKRYFFFIQQHFILHKKSLFKNIYIKLFYIFITLNY